MMNDAMVEQVLSSPLTGLAQPMDVVHEASKPVTEQHDAHSEYVLHANKPSADGSSHQPRLPEADLLHVTHELTVDVRQEHEAVYPAGAPSDLAQDTTMAIVPTGPTEGGSAGLSALDAAGSGNLAVSRPRLGTSSPSSDQDAQTAEPTRPHQQMPPQHLALLQQQESQPAQQQLTQLSQLSPPQLQQQHDQEQPQQQQQQQGLPGHSAEDPQGEQQHPPLAHQQLEQQQRHQVVDHFPFHQQQLQPQQQLASEQQEFLAPTTSTAPVTDHAALDDNDGAIVGLALLGQAASGMAAHDGAAAINMGAGESALLYSGARISSGSISAGYGPGLGLGGSVLHGKSEGVTCQVPGCHVNLAAAGVSTYFRRHRVCLTHAKADNVIISGHIMRFCQQCGIMHALAEFDGNRKSCRVQLDRHNLRRRCRRKTQLANKQRKTLEDTSRGVGGGSVSPTGGWGGGYGAYLGAGSPTKGGKSSRAAARAAAAAFAAAAESTSGIAGDSSREQEGEDYCYGDAEYGGEMGYGMMEYQQDGAMYDHMMDPAAAAAGYYQQHPQQQQQQQQVGMGGRGVKKSASYSNMREQQQQQQGVYAGGQGYSSKHSQAYSYGAPPPHNSRQQQQQMAQYYQSEYEYDQQQHWPQDPLTDPAAAAATWPPEPAAAAAAPVAAIPPTLGPLSPTAGAVAAAAAGSGGTVRTAAASKPPVEGLPADISPQDLRLLIANAVAHGQGPGITAVRGLGFVQQMLLVDELATGIMQEYEETDAGSGNRSSAAATAAAAAAAPPIQEEWQNQPAAAAAAGSAPQQLLSLMQQLVKSNAAAHGASAAAAAAGGGGGSHGPERSASMPRSGISGLPLKRESTDPSYQQQQQKFHHQQQQQARKRSRPSDDGLSSGGWQQQDLQHTGHEARNRVAAAAAAAMSAAGANGSLLQQMLRLTNSALKNNNTETSPAAAAAAAAGGDWQQASPCGLQHDRQYTYDDVGDLPAGNVAPSALSPIAAAAAEGQIDGSSGPSSGHSAALAAAAALLAAAGIKSSETASGQHTDTLTDILGRRGAAAAANDRSPAAAAAAAVLQSPRSAWAHQGPGRIPAPLPPPPAAAAAATDHLAAAAARVPREVDNQVSMSAALLRALTGAQADLSRPDSVQAGKSPSQAQPGSNQADRTAVLLSNLLQQIASTKH